MTKVVAVVAWRFLLPINLTCDAIGTGKTEYRELARMLINALIWTVIGVAVVALSV